MKFRSLFLSMLIPVSVMAMSACANPLSSLLGGNPNSPSSSSSGTPTTDTFNGSLAPGGALVFTFSVGNTGSVAITLTSVLPPTTAPLALGVGLSSNGTCTIANSTSGVIASGTPQLSGTQNPGSYCVRVSDPGSLTVTSNVTVTVSHP
jgi:hypothetical protein